MNQHTADTEARRNFNTMEDVQTVWVCTFVQAGRFTARETADMRRWATQASVAMVGEQATADWQAEFAG